jgi:hypothetical protein
MPNKFQIQINRPFLPIFNLSESGKFGVFPIKKVDLLEDCTSPVVIPGIVDYTKQANAAFQRFVAAGMQMIQSFSLLL